MRSRVPAAAAVLLVTATSLATLSGQSQTPFRTGVDLVQLDVVVLDGDRRPVEGLTAADFTVIDEGKPRAIVAFTPVTLPAPDPATDSAAWTREVTADVVRNERPAEGRLVVILFDRSILAGPQTVVARTIARAAVDALGPGDMAAVVRDSGFAGEGLAQNFTADKARLRQAIDSPFVGLVNMPSIAPGGLSERVAPELKETGDCLCGLCVLESIERVAGALTGAPGRQKTVLFLGTDLVVHENPLSNQGGRLDCHELVRYGTEKALRALDRANATLHSIDTSGLETASDPASMMGGPRAALRRRYIVARQENLSFFPDYTGGRVVVNTNAPQDLIPQIFDENRSYYLIGFEAADPRPREQRHDIQVRVNRRDVTVRTRKGYYTGEAAVPKSPSGDLASQAIVDLLPASGVPLSLVLAPRFQADGTAVVSVQFGIEPARFRPPPTPVGSAETEPASSRAVAASAAGADDGQTHLDVMLGVFDRQARPVGSSKLVVAVPAPPAVVRAGGHESVAHLSLPPGDYEIRLGLSGLEGASGSVFGYVSVPDLTRNVLALSGVMIGARAREASGGAAQPADDTSPAIAPTLRRTFSVADIVAAFLQVRRADPAHLPVMIDVRVVDEHNRVVTTSTTTLGAEAFRATGIADVSIPLPIGRLTPGRYLLSIDADDGRDRQQQNVPFQAVSEAPHREP